MSPDCPRGPQRQVFVAGVVWRRGKPRTQPALLFLTQNSTQQQSATQPRSKIEMCEKSSSSPSSRSRRRTCDCCHRAIRDSRNCLAGVFRGHTRPGDTGQRCLFTIRAASGRLRPPSSRTAPASPSAKQRSRRNWPTRPGASPPASRPPRNSKTDRRSSSSKRHPMICWAEKRVRNATSRSSRACPR